MGNLRSIRRALERLGAQVEVTDDAAAVARADRLVIPGQGAFGQATRRLQERGLVEPLCEVATDGRPTLGICLGLQLFYERSEEDPAAHGLGWIEGAVTLLPAGGDLKRPHMGWAPVAHASPHPVLSANPPGTPYYFVHSYAARTAPGWEAATVEHGETVVAAVAKDRVVGTQFHPEKSQEAGARLLEAWLTL